MTLRAMSRVVCIKTHESELQRDIEEISACGPPLPSSCPPRSIEANTLPSVASSSENNIVENTDTFETGNSGTADVSDQNEGNQGSQVWNFIFE